jgi:hypothetical protein
MERVDEEGGTQESSRRGAWQVRRARAQPGQAAGQSGQRPQRRLGQKPGEDYCGTAQRAASPAWASEEAVNTVIAVIRARYGESAIGRGDRGIRYHCHP